jgi:prepilin-type N-terminal cleavage/methylation domain-containing protein
MLHIPRNRPGGFTLIELLIVVAIIGIIAALIVPNLLDAIQKGRQKRTVGEMRNAGTAMFSWVTEQHSAAAAGDDPMWSVNDYGEGWTKFDEVRERLEPRHIQTLPRKDGWGHDYHYFLAKPPFPAMGTDDPAARFVYVRSMGRGTDYDGPSYTVGPFNATNYIQDIVWADGYFIRWPGRVRLQEGG